MQSFKMVRPSVSVLFVYCVRFPLTVVTTSAAKLLENTKIFKNDDISANFALR